MKSIFPILTMTASALALAAMASAQVPSSQQVTAAKSGSELVAEAGRRLDAQSSLSAKMRQRIHLFGQDLSGSGAYTQLGQGPQRYLRMEMRMQLATMQASLLQVCDGRFMWIRQELPGRKTLGRVDLRQIHESLAFTNEEPQLDPVSNYMVLGGLPKLLAGLDREFEFGEPTAAKIGNEPMLAIRGTWKMPMLRKLAAGQEAPLESAAAVDWGRIPDQVPDSVVVMLGANDLFPYRVEYHRAARIPGGKPGNYRNLSTIEFYEVQLGAELDPLQFIYKPGDVEVADHTPLYMQKLGLAPSGKVLR